MGKYYRNGRLWSGETISAQGSRTLAAATEATIWGGSATSRTVPSSQLVKLVSSSVQDDGSIPATFDRWDVTVGGTADVGDVARITINGINFDYSVGAGATTTVIATGLKDAVLSGSIEKWNCTPGGSLDVGDIYRIEIDGLPHEYTVQGGDTLANVCAGLANAVNTDFGGDPNYTAASVGGTKVVCTAKARGTCPNVICSMPTDPGADTTFVASVVVAGVAADTNYAATSSTNVVTLINNISGVTADIVAASYPTDPGANSTCTAVHTTTGADASGGTGVRSVKLTYLNGSGVVSSETINLDGTTAVSSVATDITGIVSVVAASVGSGGVAAGTISVKDNALAVIFEQIAAGACETASAEIKVPAGRVAYVSAIQLGAGATSTTFRLRSDCNPATGAVVSGASYTWAQTLVGTDPVVYQPAGPIGPFPAGAKIWVTGSHAAGTGAVATIEAYFEPA